MKAKKKFGMGLNKTEKKGRKKQKFFVFDLLNASFNLMYLIQ